MVSIPYPFSSVALNSIGRNAASPMRPDDPDWTGIVLAIPKQMSFRREPGARRSLSVLPVCGYRSFAVSLDGRQPFVLLCRDLQSGGLYRGEVQDYRDPSPRAPDPNPTPVRLLDVKDMMIGEFFNTNLIDFVPLPDRAGSYEVWAEHRGARSNRETIAIVEER